MDHSIVPPDPSSRWPSMTTAANMLNLQRGLPALPFVPSTTRRVRARSTETGNSNERPAAAETLQHLIQQQNMLIQQMMQQQMQQQQLQFAQQQQQQLVHDQLHHVPIQQQQQQQQIQQAASNHNVLPRPAQISVPGFEDPNRLLSQMDPGVRKLLQEWLKTTRQLLHQHVTQQDLKSKYEKSNKLAKL